MVYDITNTWNLKNQQIYMAKWKHTHCKIKQTKGYQWGEGLGEKEYWGREFRSTNY